MTYFKVYTGVYVCTCMLRFQFLSIENLEDDEIQVKVKMKKNNWSVELSARNVQTSTHPGNPVTESIKSILR